MKYNAELFISALKELETAYNNIKKLAQKFEKILQVKNNKYYRDFNSVLEDINGVKKNLSSEDIIAFNTYLSSSFGLYSNSTGIIPRMYYTIQKLSQLDLNFYEYAFSFLQGEDKFAEALNYLDDVDRAKEFVENILNNGIEDEQTAKLLKKLFSGYDKCSQTANFSDMTDYQNIFLSGVATDLYSILGEKYGDKLEGKTIKEIINIVDENDKDYDFIMRKLLNMSVYGFADIRVCEVIKGEDGANSFSGFVLEDKKGNYNIVYNGTEGTDIADTSFDGMVFAKYLGDNSNSEGLKNFVSMFSSFGSQYKNILNNFGLLTEDINNFQVSEYGYKDLSESYAEKYGKYAKDNGKKVYICGYSLGGANAEYAANYMVKNYKNQIGEISIFNALNANLTNEEFENMKKLGKDKFKVYINQGDIVSKVVNEEVFEDYAINISVDWKNILSEQMQEVDMNQNKLKVDQNVLNIINYAFGSDAKELNNFLTNGIQYADLLLQSGCHSYHVALNADSFDENGNLIQDVKTTSFETISNEVFGTDVREMIIDLSETNEFNRIMGIVNRFGYSTAFYDEKISNFFGEGKIQSGVATSLGVINTLNNPDLWVTAADVGIDYGFDAVDGFTDQVTNYTSNMEESSYRNMSSKADKLRENWDENSWWENTQATAGVGVSVAKYGISTVVDKGAEAGEFIVDTGASVVKSGKNCAVWVYDNTLGKLF